MSDEIKRKRGAPFGNSNAVKHGYYTRELNKAERDQYLLATGMEGIAEEITLLRYEIKKAVTGGDIKNLVPLVKATEALEKLLRTHDKLFSDKTVNVERAVENVIRDFTMQVIPVEKRLETLLMAKQFASNHDKSKQ